MNEAQKYWRDKVTNVLQWGAAVFILFAGWAVDHHERFGLWSKQRDEILAAIGLLSVTTFYAPLLPLAVRYIYKKFLTPIPDETVLPQGFALTCAFVLSVLTWVVAFLMSYF